MTLVALAFDGSTFTCCADSRITRPSSMGSRLAVISNEYCKIQKIVGTVSNSGGTRQFFEFGVGFAGNVFVATVAITNFSNIVSNLHAESEDLPDMDVVAEIFRKVGSEVSDRLKISVDNPGVEFLLFGFCPKTKDARAFVLRTETGTDPLRLKTDAVPIFHGRVIGIGTGTVALEAILANPTGFPTNASFPSIVYKAVIGGADPGTGGGILIATADKNGVEIVPVLTPASQAETEVDINLTMSGINLDGWKFDGGFAIGSRAIMVGAEKAQNNQWIKRLGYELRPGIDAAYPIRHLASMHLVMELQSIVDLNSLHYLVHVESRPDADATSRCVCPKCGKNQGIFWSRTGANVPHSFRNGQFSFMCSGCNTIQTVAAERVFSCQNEPE